MKYQMQQKQGKQEQTTLPACGFWIVTDHITQRFQLV
jgi:hypothetical protein